MALRYSTGLRNKLRSGYGYREALANGVLKVYSGTQPTSADSAATGTLLGTFTVDGNAYTGETRAVGTITLSATESGSVDTVLAGGLFPLIGAAVDFDTSHTITAAALAAAISAYKSTPRFEATSDGAVVTVYAPYGTGAVYDTLALASTSTDLTTADTAFASGVTAVNGLGFLEGAVVGTITKTADVWQATVITAGGTAGWFRWEADTLDDQAVSTVFARLDGSIATSGADFNLTSTALAGDSVQTISNFTITVPANA